MPFVPQRLKNEDGRVFLGNCAHCDEPIYEDEAHYEFSDAELVCDDPDCLYGWAEQYKHNGVTYGW